jgi:CDP-diacylglycerol--glycerol-3-phosphate 3-phosphatidyltransferase
MSIADFLTTGRIVVAPIVLILFLVGDNKLRMLGFILFSLGAISDFIDGYIARRTRISSFGKLWDPIADKFLAGLGLIALSCISILPWWITILLILRDIIITIVRLVIIQKRGIIITPILPAKLKTMLELIMLWSLLGWAAILGLSKPPWLEIAILIVGSVVIMLSWGTGIYYLVSIIRKKQANYNQSFTDQ